MSDQTEKEKTEKWIDYQTERFYAQLIPFGSRDVYEAIKTVIQVNKEGDWLAEQIEEFMESTDTKLENIDVVHRRIMAFPNYEKLKRVAIIFGVNVPPNSIDKVVAFLKNRDDVKFLWKTYGTHDMIFIIVCDNDNIGNSINDLRKSLEQLEVSTIHLDSSTSISWDKIELNPY